MTKDSSPTTEKKRFVRTLVFDRGTPSDTGLAELAREYVKSNGGKYADPQDGRCWLVIEADGDNPWKCVGLMRGQRIIDFPEFHVDDESARDLLIARATAWMDEAGLNETPVLIFVSPQQERLWLRFLRGVKAKKAHRWAVVSRVDLP